jgi:hypothetical protein
MSLLGTLDWAGVLDHYRQREAVHERLLKLHYAGQAAPFAELLVRARGSTG